MSYNTLAALAAIGSMGAPVPTMPKLGEKEPRPQVWELYVNGKKTDTGSYEKMTAAYNNLSGTAKGTRRRVELIRKGSYRG